MTERNIFTSTFTAIATPFVDFFYPMRYFLILAAVLIIFDLRLGIQKSRAKKEEIRTSRAVRRTMNKGMDYICWITVAGLFGKSFGEAFGIPILPFVMLLVVYGIEANSCYNNYFAARGINKKVNIFAFFARKADIMEPENKTDK